MKFDPTKAYVFDLSNQLEFGKVKKARLIDKMGDGRILGLLCSILVAETFSDLTLIEDPAAQYDITSDGRDKRIRYECKAQVGSNSFSLTPSKMKGKGRSFDRVEYEKWVLTAVDKIILIRGEEFPALHVMAIDTTQIRRNKKNEISQTFSLGDFDAEFSSRKQVKVA